MTKSLPTKSVRTYFPFPDGQPEGWHSQPDDTSWDRTTDEEREQVRDFARVILEAAGVL